MKMRMLLACLVVSTLGAAPDTWEVLTTRSGKEFHKAKVVSVDVIGIKITHDSGIAKIPFQDLSEELQKQFSYDPAKAEVAQKEANQEQAARAKKDAIQSLVAT